MGVSAAEQAVLDRIDEGSLVELTTSLVRAAGQNPPGDEAATVRVLSTAAAELGLDVVETAVEPDRNNVRITLEGGTGPGLLLLGHTDVVPVGDGWTVDPFGAAVHDGRIYGRGASDMKGGLAAALSALAALRGVGLSGPVELAALVDEEESGKGIRAYVESVRRPFLGCVTAEPTDLQTIIGARGASYLRVEIHGKACHAGNPDDGANAIYGAAAVVAEIERLHAELAKRPHPLLGPATWNVGRIDGGTGGSIVPAECVVVADRRLLPGESTDVVLDELRERVAGLGLADRGLTVDVAMPMDMPAFETPADSDLACATDAALTDAGGPGMPLGGWTGACDGGFVARDLGVPVVVLGPGSATTQAHRADESVAIEQLLVAARAYALTALRLLSQRP
jgi:acetylornithine deacetylase